MNVHRFGVKFFAANPESVQLEAFIPIFHGWIQKQNLTGHLLIDVHDYSHMHHGPGVLLVAHEGNFSLDMADGRPGLMYYRKTPTALEPVEHIVAILKSALQACRHLEKDARLRFSMAEFVIIANDRLNAPNEENTLAELRPVITGALREVFGDSDFKLARWSDDPRERFALRVSRVNS